MNKALDKQMLVLNDEIKKSTDLMVGALLLPVNQLDDLTPETVESLLQQTVMAAHVQAISITMKHLNEHLARK